MSVHQCGNVRDALALLGQQGGNVLADDTVDAGLKHQLRVLPEQGRLVLLKQRAYDGVSVQPCHNGVLGVLEPPTDEVAFAVGGGADVEAVVAAHEHQILPLLGKEAACGKRLPIYCNVGVLVLGNELFELGVELLRGELHVRKVPVGVL